MGPIKEIEFSLERGHFSTIKKLLHILWTNPVPANSIWFANNQSLFLCSTAIIVQSMIDHQFQILITLKVFFNLSPFEESFFILHFLEAKFIEEFFFYFFISSQVTLFSLQRMLEIRLDWSAQQKGTQGK